MLLILGILVVVNLYVFVWDKKTGVRAIQKQAQAQPTMSVPEHALLPPPPPPITSPPGAVGGPQTHPATRPTIVGVVTKGDRLGTLLKKSGLTAAEGDEVIRALSGVLDYKKLQIGEAYRIERGPDGRVQRFELDLTKSHHVRAERKPSGDLVGASDPVDPPSH